MDLGVWADFTAKIREHITNEGVENFQNWPVIQQTMLAGIDEVEFVELNQSPYWPLWQGKLGETTLRPNSYHRYPESSTNNMHHAYSLDVMMQYTGVKLNEYSSVVEFGGGYGNTCRLFKEWGFNGYYIIYDIPELLKIQDYYLGKCDADADVFLIGGDTPVSDMTEKSLFLGLWSISEVPVNEREKILQNLKFYTCDNIFIAMGETFYNEDNMAWLKNEVIPQLDALGYEHKFKRIEHGQGMWYFMAKKRV